MIHKIVIRSKGAPPSKPTQPNSFLISKKKFMLVATGLGILWLSSIILALSFKTVFLNRSTSIPRAISESTPKEDNNISNLRLSDYIGEAELLQKSISIEKYAQAQKISESVIGEWVKQADGMGLEQLEKGKEILVLTAKSGLANDRLLLYKMSADKSILFKTTPTPEVKVHFKTVQTQSRAAGGVIKTTFWEAILDCNIHYRIMGQIEDAMRWAVDFYHLRPGDTFKVVYEEKRAGDEVVGVGRLKAVYFKTASKVCAAYWIDGVEKTGYYGDDGKPVQKTFLRCPLKYERVTSYYDLNRLHPVSGTVKPHFGTDFAAPEGTPIFAVADGVMETVAFTTNNGNYVKIRHDLEYETQYLHMVRFEAGVQPGTHVKQGQVIGFVGQTGLATGPHVCFRFWKNGQQVDPFEELPNLKPFHLGIKDQDRYLALKDGYAQQLREIVYMDGNL